MNRRVLQVAVLTMASVVMIIATGATRARARQPAAPGTLDATRPIRYFIADGTGQAGFRPPDRQLAVWALGAWERSAGKRVRFEPATESNALIRLYWAESSEGQYGETRPLTVGGRRGAAVYVRPDVDSLGGDIARRARNDALLRDTIVYLTCLHELGHALGLTHTSDFLDIMYSFGYGGDIAGYFERYRRQLRSRNDIATVAGVSDADTSHLRAMYP